MSLGKNTASGEMLLSFVERVERVRGEKKQLSADESAIMADAKANGFTPKAIGAVVKIRAMKPHDRQESEALLDMYLHALGMASEPPLFRAAGLAAIDTTARDQVIERMKDFVPPAGKGDIVVNMDGKALRLRRDKEGAVEVQEVIEKPVQAATPKAAAAPKAEIPAVDGDGAEALGRHFAKGNKPVISNPFPFGDARRARFDEGWRKETGSDGMGPKDDD
jgi:uncharacterized protein (UPF0335 family)